MMGQQRDCLTGDDETGNMFATQINESTGPWMWQRGRLKCFYSATLKHDKNMQQLLVELINFWE